MDKQYHIIIKGFDISKTNKQGEIVGTSDIRHYRYMVEETVLSTEGGAHKFTTKKDKTLLSIFPVSETIVLVEDVREERVR